MAAELGDSITLNGATLLVKGIQAGKPVSEFTSSLRVGRATYDDRQHAGFTVLDDFSGGFGHRQLDVREEVGTHWDNEGAADLRRSRHITLPPKRYLVAANAQPTNFRVSAEILDGAVIGVPADDPGVNSYLYFGAGDSIYRMPESRQALTRVKDLSGEALVPDKMTRMFLFRGADNVRRLYVITTNGAINSQYWYSANPGAASPTFTQGNQYLWDAIVFENLVIGQQAGMQFISNATPNNTNAWNIDVAGDLTPLWRSQSIVHFLGVALAPTGNWPVVYFIDYGDGRLYALDPYIRRAWPIEIGDFHYLLNGIVWQGQVAVTDGWSIWLYSPGGGGTETVRRIGLWGKDGSPDSVRTGRYRITGLVDGGEFLFAIAERTLFGKDVSKATLGFVVFVYNGAGWSQYTEKREELGSATTIAINPIAAMVDRFPTGVLAAADVGKQTSRALNIFCQAHPTSAKLVQLHTYRWPQLGSVPLDKVDEFDAAIPNGHAFLTGWFDGGFNDLEGALFYIKIDLQSDGGAGGAVEVQYRLNDDETAAFTSLGSAVDRGSTTFQFDATNEAGIQFRTVQFKVLVKRGQTSTLTGAMSVGQTTVPVAELADFPDVGVVGIDTAISEYITYEARSATSGAGNLTGATRGVRGSTAASHISGAPVHAINRTPELRGITVCYRKKANLRRTWVVRIDVNKMVEQGTLVDTDLDGTPDTAATHQNVLDFIEGIWDKKTLVRLVAGNLIPLADNSRVEIADYTVNEDDNRLPSTQRGTIDLIVIEPVAV